MKTYEFKIHLILCNDRETVHHTISADSYQAVYVELLKLIPTKYAYDYFYIDPGYTVNNKRRVSK